MCNGHLSSHYMCAYCTFSILPVPRNFHVVAENLHDNVDYNETAPLVLGHPRGYQRRVGGNLQHTRRLDGHLDVIVRSCWLLFLMLSVSPKQALNSPKNSSKLFSNGDYFSNNGANHAKVVPLSNVRTNPTHDASVGYREECIWIIRRTWLMNPLNCDRVPSNFILEIPWVLVDPCCCNDTIVASSCCTRNANSSCCCVYCFSIVIWWRSPNKC